MAAYFIVCLGYALDSGMGASRPSRMAAASVSLASRIFRCAGLRPMLVLDLDILLAPGEECRFGGGSKPRLASMEPHSISCASILALIWRAWSAIRLALLSAVSLSSCSIFPLRSRFSESSRAHSFSRARIRSDWFELTLAMSRFCRRNFFRTTGNHHISGLGSLG